MAAEIHNALTVQARGLGDPTRSAIFRYIDGADTPVGIAELTDRFGLNHNAIRQHVAKLRDAALVLEEVAAPCGPGRPALLYRANPGAAGRWDSNTPYERLAALLIEMLRSGDDPRTVGQAAGRELAKGEPRDRDRVDVLEDVTRRLGFEPRKVERRGSEEIVLDRCPFVASVLTAPEIVCELHRGLAEGLVSEPGGARVADLVIRPPKRAGCRIVLDISERAR